MRKDIFNYNSLLVAVDPQGGITYMSHKPPNLSRIIVKTGIKRRLKILLA